MDDNWKEFTQSLGSHLNDPDWISGSAIKLATLLYNHNQELAQADLDEKKALVRYLDSTQYEVGERGPKKMSVAEAESRAIVETSNGYKLKKVQAEAIIETINALKKRLDVLSWERKNG